MILAGCDKSESTYGFIHNTFCADCSFSDSSVSVEVNENVLTRIDIPNIVIKDDSEDGLFSFGYHFSKENFESFYIEPVEIVSTIRNDDGVIIHSFYTTEFDSNQEFIKIWDGGINEEPYTGTFRYYIQLKFVDNQFIKAEGKAIATTCEDILNCAKNNSPFFDLVNCRYHYQLKGCHYSTLCQ